MSEDSQPRTTKRRSLRRASSHSWAEIDLAAVRHNVRAVKGLLGGECHLWAVVKAGAYGHGAVPTARAALDAGADGLAVSSLGEASQLRRAGIGAPILHLGPGEPRSARRILRLDVVQSVCTEPVVRALSRAAQRLSALAKVHLKIDTGMGRLGVSPEGAATFARLIAELPQMRLTGAFSHLATADADDPEYALAQFERFQEALRAIDDAGLGVSMRHLANSAGALRFPDMRLEAVRAGLLIYGIRPDSPGLAPLDLRPALTWKTRVAFVHRLPAGSPISYGRTYITPHECDIGVLPVGYADGYPRSASNRARVLVRGRPCSVVGVICMDHTMVDLGPAGGARIGDEVVLVGRQGNSCVTANQLAQWAGTVVHEVPTAIGRRVKRVYRGAKRALDPSLGPEGEGR